MLYCQTDEERESGLEPDPVTWRTAFQRDYGRVIHSPAFRRLQGKTQVFPGHESDYFRNRLTHSLEVAQIAEGIAERLNATTAELIEKGQAINPRLCATAALLHDLGHPPFGHNGERALDDAMCGNGGFEGNAQTLRIVARLEKKLKHSDGSSIGLGLCFRTLASALKYDNPIPRAREVGSKICKGYYATEAQLVARIKKAVVPSGLPESYEFKTVECQIMDLADDIAYSTFDLEDSLKAGFLTPSEILASEPRLLEEVAKEISQGLKSDFPVTKILSIFAEIFISPNPFHYTNETDGLAMFSQTYRAYSALASDGYLRTAFSSELIKKAINSITLRYDTEYPMLSIIEMSHESKERVETLKQYTFVSTIYSSRVKLPEFRGYEVVSGIFHALASKKGFLMMPEDVRENYRSADGDLDTQRRVICDFVAGMTDRYAMEFFGRLHSDSAQSMFKPV